MFGGGFLEKAIKKVEEDKALTKVMAAQKTPHQPNNVNTLKTPETFAVFWTRACLLGTLSRNNSCTTNITTPGKVRTPSILSNKPVHQETIQVVTVENNSVDVGTPYTLNKLNIVLYYPILLASCHYPRQPDFLIAFRTGRL